MRDSIEDVNGFPSLVLENGQDFETLISWRPKDGGIAMTAGNTRYTVLLKENNCDLAKVRRDLASIITDVHA